MAASETCVPRAICAQLSYGARALAISATSASAICGTPILSKNAPTRAEGHVTAVIVDSATLRSGVVRDSHGGLVTDASPTSTNKPELKRSRQRAMRRNDRAIIVDLP